MSERGGIPLTPQIAKETSRGKLSFVPPRCTGRHPDGERCPWPMGHPTHGDCDAETEDPPLTDDQSYMYPE